MSRPDGPPSSALPDAYQQQAGDRTYLVLDSGREDEWLSADASAVREVLP